MPLDLRFINFQKVAKKRKINKPLKHPKWGKKDVAKEIKEKIFIANVKGAIINAVYLK